MNRILEVKDKKYIIDSMGENSIGKFIRFDTYPSSNEHNWIIVYANKNHNFKIISSLLYDEIENKYPELLL